MTTQPSFGAAPVVAPRLDSTTWYSGASVTLEIHAIAEGIKSRNWVEGGIGALGVAAEGAGVMVDPIGALASWGVGWMMEHVEPLARILDMLSGDPDQVAAYAQTWLNIATITNTTAEMHEEYVRNDLPDWRDGAGAAYRSWSAERVETMRGLREAAEGMAGLAGRLSLPQLSGWPPHW